MQHRFAAALAIGVVAAAARGQGVPPDYGLDFVTIGDPGNRNTNDVEAPLVQFGGAIGRHFGSVDYRYRLTRTEITQSQYLEFAQAYAPFYLGDPSDLQTRLVRWNGSSFSVSPEYDDYFVSRVPFRFAATMCNWLHNDKRNEPWAFQTGAYDVFAFTNDPVTGHPTDRNVRLPGARYWIPSFDEWMKGMYWDPEKDGVGGYWCYPDSGDEPLTEDETDAFPQPDDVFQGLGPAGAFPGVQSPWGLLGGSGGAAELFENPADPFGTGEYGWRLFRASSRGFQPAADELDDVLLLARSHDHRVGFRLASAVPAPSSGVVVLLGLLATKRRRRCTTRARSLRQ